jgi:hypothetical protein
MSTVWRENHSIPEMITCIVWTTWIHNIRVIRVTAKLALNVRNELGPRAAEVVQDSHGPDTFSSVAVVVRRANS